MLELWMVRHGQTDFSRENRFCGSIDPPLSDLGKRMADALVDEGLREISYGDWEGMKHEEAKAKFPDAYAYWAQDTASRATPGGETAFMVAARAAPVIERIRREHQESGRERVLVVSHKATI